MRLSICFDSSCDTLDPPRIGVDGCRSSVGGGCHEGKEREREGGRGREEYRAAVSVALVI